jgi:hypothetical protein
MDTIATKHLHRYQLSAVGLLTVVCQVTWAGSNPVPFNQWTVNNGVIDTSAACSAQGVSCTVLAEDDGFLQQQVITDSGSYVQMILTDPGASGSPDTLAFTTENFVPDKNLSGFDIANRQLIRDIPEGFEQIAQIDRAPFEDPKNGLVNLIHVDLSQTLTSQDFEADFQLVRHEAELPSGEILSGQTVDIQQTVTGMDPYGIPNVINTFSNQQSSGVQLSNVDGALLIDPFTTAADIQIAGETFKINDGDEIKLTEITQHITSLPGDAGFKLQMYENATQDISASEVSIIDPFSPGP